MNPLPPQLVKDFINKLATSPEKVLVMFLDMKLGIGFNVVGKLKLLEEGVLVVQDEGDPDITESSGLNTTLGDLLRFPCEFVDPRDFKSKPTATAFLRDEVPLDFALKFLIPDRVFSIMQIKGPS